MSMIGVADAAKQLDVSPRRVRQMLSAGQLSGEQVGRVWLVDRGSLDEACRSRSEVGRPWRPEAAWAFIGLMQGDDVELSAVDQTRIGRRVESGVAANLGRLRARSVHHKLYGHPSVLERMRALTGLVRTGVSAADDHSIDIIAQDHVELYARSSVVDDLIDRFALDEATDAANITLRVVNDDVWPFGVSDEVAPPLVVAIDLLDAGDERTRRAGAELLERL